MIKNNNYRTNFTSSNNLVSIKKKLIDISHIYV